jgi:hypothetical protein
METKELISVNTNQSEYSAQTRVHQGRNHLVVPVTMMVEGVHHGSAGPVLHLATELGKFPESWNGIPIIIDHPRVEGQNISANAPDVIDERSVGRVYHTHMNGSKLRSEAWLDEDKLRQLSPTAHEHIQNGLPLEVSVGVFTEDEIVDGDWNGETYEAIARNLRPDHLALLPGGIGACSWNDGCGVRTNSKKEGGNDVTADETKTLKLQNIQSIIENNTDQGYKTVVNAAQNKLDAMDNQDSMHFLQDVFESYVVYEVRLRIGGSHMYKQNYTFNNGVFELKDTPTEVTKKIEFVEVHSAPKLTRGKFNTNVKKEVNTMGETSKCPECVKIVNDLIANKRFTEEQRPELEALSKPVLEAISKQEVKEVVREVEKIIEVNKLTPEQSADIAYVQKLRQEKRTSLIKGIQANTAKDLWSDAELAAMSDATLEKMAASVTKKEEEEVNSYSVIGARMETNAQAGDDEPLYPAGVTIEK